MHFQNTAGIGANQYDEQFVVLFTLTMAQLKQVSSLTYLVIWWIILMTTVKCLSGNWRGYLIQVTLCRSPLQVNNNMFISPVDRQLKEFTRNIIIISLYGNQMYIFRALFHVTIKHKLMLIVYIILYFRCFPWLLTSKMLMQMARMMNRNLFRTWVCFFVHSWRSMVSWWKRRY